MVILYKSDRRVSYDINIRALLSFLTLTISSCTLNTPSDPEWSNPFDRNNPNTSGDPYQLQAEIVPAGVQLQWQTIEMEGLNWYNVYRKVDNSEFSLLNTATPLRGYLDRDIQHIHRYEYYVVANFPEGEADHEHLLTVVVNSFPSITIEADTVDYTPTRGVKLTAIAFGAKSMLLANLPDFASSEWEEFSNLKDWQLTTGEGTKTVYLQVVFDNGDTSDVYSDSIEPLPISPALAITGYDRYTAVRLIELQLSAAGERLRMKISEDAEFAGIGWVEFSETVDYELSVGAGEKTVYAKVINDFDIESPVVRDAIRPAILHPAININEDEEITNNHRLNVQMPEVGALEMMLSESVDFADAIWTDYQEAIEFELSNGDGKRMVFAKFRHEFFESEAVSDSILLDTYAVIESLIWSSDNGNPHHAGDVIRFRLTVADDALGAETRGTAELHIPGVRTELMLDDMGDGSYTGEHIVEVGNFTSEGLLRIDFWDRAGNLVRATSVDPLDIFEHNWQYIRTRDSYTIFILSAEINGESLTAGDEIGVFRMNGKCAGMTRIDDTGLPVNLPAWGDDMQTESVDGFIHGEAMVFRFWDADQMRELDAQVVEIVEGGNVEYQTDGLVVLRLVGGVE